MKNIKFTKACQEIRRKHGKIYLKKSELAEAYDLYKQADENLVKFQELLRGVHIRGIIEKRKVKDPVRHHSRFNRGVHGKANTKTT